VARELGDGSEARLAARGRRSFTTLDQMRGQQHARAQQHARGALRNLAGPQTKERARRRGEPLQLLHARDGVAVGDPPADAGERRPGQKIVNPLGTQRRSLELKIMWGFQLTSVASARPAHTGGSSMISAALVGRAEEFPFGTSEAAVAALFCPPNALESLKIRL